MFSSTDTTTDLLTTDNTPEDRELEVLAHVHRAQSSGEDAGETPSPAHVSQRSIAQALGMSVGLTNAILKRLADKGFLMMRRINAHNVHYLVTPAGIDQISRRSYHYLRRTIGHVVRYKERLRAFCREQKERGITEVVLVGESDLTFLLEWCCEKEGLAFRQVVEPSGSDSPVAAGALTVLSERTAQAEFTESDTTAVPLHEVVIGNVSFKDHP